MFVLRDDEPDKYGENEFIITVGNEHVRLPGVNYKKLYWGVIVIIFRYEADRAATALTSDDAPDLYFHRASTCGMYLEIEAHGGLKAGAKIPLRVEALLQLLSRLKPLIDKFPAYRNAIKSNDILSPDYIFDTDCAYYWVSS